MDGFIKLFCGCCGTQDESDLPYRPLDRSEEVIPVRDPPIINPNLYQTAHVNGGFDEVDARPIESETNSPLPTESEKTEKERDKDLLNEILATTQHNIITVGHMEYSSLATGENMTRERKYDDLVKQNDDNTKNVPTSSEHVYDFDLITLQRPIELPLLNDDDAPPGYPHNHIRPHFTGPSRQHTQRSRPLGLQTSTFLAEHPDVKKIGKLPAIPQATRQKLRDCVKEIHNGVEECQIEHKTDLVVHMDF